jgi:hypothetical protein
MAPYCAAVSTATILLQELGHAGLLPAQRHPSTLTPHPTLPHPLPSYSPPVRCSPSPRCICCPCACCPEPCNCPRIECLILWCVCAASASFLPSSLISQPCGCHLRARCSSSALCTLAACAFIRASLRCRSTRHFSYTSQGSTCCCTCRGRAGRGGAESGHVAGTLAAEPEALGGPARPSSQTQPCKRLARARAAAASAPPVCGPSRALAT